MEEQATSSGSPPLSLEPLVKTQGSWPRRTFPRSTSVGGPLRGNDRQLASQPAKTASESVRDDSQVIAAHFSRQQARLRRNIIMIDSDEDWIRGMEKNVSSRCGTLAFFRRHGCPSCNYMAPKVSETSNDFELQHGADISFIEIDVDKSRRTTSKYKCDTFAPAFCVFSHGELQATFSGVSTRVFSQQVQNLSSSTTTCTRCTSGMRSSFDRLEEQVPVVIALGHLEDGVPLTTPACSKGKDCSVPNGERVMPFDVSGILEPARSRLDLLEERLRGRPGLWHVAHGGRNKALAMEFLASNTDEGLDIAQARHLAVAWLTARLGHMSLWTPEERQAVTAIADAIVSRRATRAEYWLLRTLSAINGRQSALERWSNEIRASFNEKLCKHWMSVRPCNQLCDLCEMPCMLPRSHTGDHSCDCDDHDCHRVVVDGEEFGSLPPSSPGTKKEKCCLHAGHGGPCMINPVVVFDLGDQGVCAICLDALPRFRSYDCRDDVQLEDTEGEQEPAVFTYPCNHVFHYKCAEPWHQRSSHCPLCRRPSLPPRKRGTKLDVEVAGAQRQPSSPHLRPLRRTQTRPRPGWRSQANDEDDRRSFASTHTGVLFPASRNASSLGLPALPEIEHLAATVSAQALSSRSVSSVALPSLPGASTASGRGLLP